MDELNFDETKNPTGFIMPSNPADRKHIMDVMNEISASKTRAEAERDFQKEAISELFQKFKIPKKQLNRFAKAHHKSAFSEELAEDEDFEVMVEILRSQTSN